MSATYNSKISAMTHNAMERLFAAGLLHPANMYEFDLLCRKDAGSDTQLEEMRRETAPPGTQALPRLYSAHIAGAQKLPREATNAQQAAIRPAPKNAAAAEPTIRPAAAVKGNDHAALAPADAVPVDAVPAERAAEPAYSIPHPTFIPGGGKKRPVIMSGEMMAAKATAQLQKAAGPARAPKNRPSLLAGIVAAMKPQVAQAAPAPAGGQQTERPHNARPARQMAPNATPDASAAAQELRTTKSSQRVAAVQADTLQNPAAKIKMPRVSQLEVPGSADPSFEAAHAEARLFEAPLFELPPLETASSEMPQGLPRAVSRQEARTAKGTARDSGKKPADTADVKVLTPEEIRVLREREGVSEAVFARCLKVLPQTVIAWEAGKLQPSATALRLLARVQAEGLNGIG